MQVEHLVLAKSTRELHASIVSERPFRMGELREIGSEVWRFDAAGADMLSFDEIRG